MHDQGYFSHTSPTYGSPFDMMRAFGVSYRTAGENIAMGYATPAAVVEAWMNSEGHRANILSANYTTLGVGYVADGGYWPQWFIGCPSKNRKKKPWHILLCPCRLAGAFFLRPA